MPEAVSSQDQAPRAGQSADNWSSRNLVQRREGRGLDDGSYLRSKRAHLENTLDGEHGREDEVQVAEDIHELQWGSLKLKKKTVYLSVLYWTVLYCTLLYVHYYMYCTLVACTVLHRTYDVLYWAVLYGTYLYSTAHCCTRAAL